MKNEINQNAVASANKEYYNEVAEDYLKNEYYAYTNEIILGVKKSIDLSIANIKNYDLFLDLGCGSGFLSKIVSEKKIFKQGLGLDISEKQIELYNDSFNNSNFEGRVCDVNNLNIISDETVDLIGGYSVLHHFYDYFNVLDECLRVLKKNGIIYFDFEPNSNFKKKLKILIKLRKIFIDKSPSTKDDLEEIAEFHNNFSDGLNFREIKKRYKNQIEIISFDYRYPGTAAGNILKKMKFMGDFTCPLFSFIARKI